MADIEKVIEGLELCVQGSKGCLKDCPYTDNGCRIQLEKDALPAAYVIAVEKVK